MASQYDAIGFSILDFYDQIISVLKAAVVSKLTRACHREIGISETLCLKTPGNLNILYYLKVILILDG